MESEQNFRRPGFRPTGPLILSVFSDTSLSHISEICESTNSGYSVVLVFGFNLGFLWGHLGKRVIGFCEGAFLISGQPCWLLLIPRLILISYAVLCKDAFTKKHLRAHFASQSVSFLSWVGQPDLVEEAGRSGIYFRL